MINFLVDEVAFLMKNILLWDTHNKLVNEWWILNFLTPGYMYKL